MTLRLRTARLVLEPFEPRHLDFLHRLWTDPRVRRYLWDDVTIARERAALEIGKSLASFHDDGFGMLVARDTADGREAGFCGLRRFGEGGDVEMMYGLAPERWGRGLATEAGREMLRWAFEDFRLARLYARTDPPNEASVRVMQRLGMDFVRRVEEHGLDLVYYVMTIEDFFSRMRKDVP